MELEVLYSMVKQIIDKVDFTLLWEDFCPLKYALYNDERCYFDGAYIEKTDAFIANTSIEFQGEYIAIWNVSEEEDIDIETLAASMIHEMFHAFQMMHHESRFPAEFEALTKYQYSSESLSVKLEENRLIAELTAHFTMEQYQRLLRLRKFRLLHYPYEFLYEAAVEQIEGTANYVELGALRQISAKKYKQSLERLQKAICEPAGLLPVRIISYPVGALLFMILKEHHLADFEFFADITTAEAILKDVAALDEPPMICPEVKDAVTEYHRRTKEMIEATLAKNQCVVQGEYELRGVNIYNARYKDGFIVSNYFVAYGVGEENHILQGNFVIQITRDMKVRKVYEM